MKAILLARVSSKEQEEGQSIPAQERRLREYAERKGLAVDQFFKITESSTKDTRKEFEKILVQIRKSKEILALVVDTIDRMQRSFKESVVLEELRKEGKVEIHFMREGLVLNLKSNSSDILRWDMGVMFARSYVLQLSDNVKRSKEQAVKSGHWIGLAPLGYIHVVDENGEKNIVPDPDRAPFIVKLFKLYTIGNYSLIKLAEEAEKVGLRTKKGKKVARSQIDSTLKNPFYCGMMRTKYGLAEHHYQPLISTTLFQQAQDVSASYHKKPHKKISEPFILRSMITCAHCGCTVTPEILEPPSLKSEGFLLHSSRQPRQLHRLLTDVPTAYFSETFLTVVEALSFIGEPCSTPEALHTLSGSFHRPERVKKECNISQLFQRREMLRLLSRP